LLAGTPRDELASRAGADAKPPPHAPDLKLAGEMSHTADLALIEFTVINQSQLFGAKDNGEADQ
jgi:hypothetical protein